MPIYRFLICLVILGTSLGQAAAQEARKLILRGTVVSPDEVVEDGFVSVAGDKIADVGRFGSSAPQGDIVETDSYILPGLIDLHNHMTWNVLPRWRPNRQFANRYEWQQEAAYKIALEIPHRKVFEQGLGCDADIYGQIKAIVNGATSVVGGFTPSKADDNQCVLKNARNLDFYSGFYGSVLNREKLRNEVFPFEIGFEDAGRIRSELSSGKLTTLIVHLAEGKPTDASSAREFRMLDKQGFARAGVVIDHGVALSREQFQVMAKRNMGLVWSPRSNIELYGSTTDVLVAKQEGVLIALAPDWSASGSDGMLEELRYAATWNSGQSPPVFSDQELLKMATIIPAKLAKLEDRIGSLKPGLYADILLIKKKNSTPYQTVTHSDAVDVRLVMANGVPLYGDLDLMNRLLPREQLEQIRLCGKEKALHLQGHGDNHDAGISWKKVSESLEAALDNWGTSLAQLSACEGTNQN